MRRACVCRLFRGARDLRHEIRRRSADSRVARRLLLGLSVRSPTAPTSSIGGNMKNLFIRAAAVSALALVVSAAPAFASDTWITTKAKLALLTGDDVSATAVHVDT